jgi:hypothetical protein
MHKLRFKDLARITEQELRKPSVRRELDEFFAEVHPDDDYMSMEDLKVEEDLFRIIPCGGVTTAEQDQQGTAQRRKDDPRNLILKEEEGNG